MNWRSPRSRLASKVLKVLLLSHFLNYLSSFRRAPEVSATIVSPVTFPVISWTPLNVTVVTENDNGKKLIMWWDHTSHSTCQHVHVLTHESVYICSAMASATHASLSISTFRNNHKYDSHGQTHSSHRKPPAWNKNNPHSVLSTVFLWQTEACVRLNFSHQSLASPSQQPAPGAQLMGRCGVVHGRSRRS